jgi:hypothetical protein
MSTQDTTRSAGTHSGRATASTGRGAGSAAFAAIMLTLGGALNIIYGIAAISDSKFFVNETKYVFSNLHTWGWITLVLGVVGVVAGFSVARGGTFGRVIGIAVAFLMAVGALLSIGGAYPFWALGVFAISLIVLHGLSVYEPSTEY